MRYKNRKVPIVFEDGLEVSRGWLAADKSRANRVLSKRAEASVNCLCTPDGVPMHVVHRAGKYHLATKPGRAHHHSLSCPSYIPQRTTSGLRHYRKGAYSSSNATQRLIVSTRPLTEPPYPHFSPGAALQFVWELAGLNVSTPKTVEKRTQFLTSRSFHQATKTLFINNKRVRCYVPSINKLDDETTFAGGFVHSIAHSTYGLRISLVGSFTDSFWINEKEWHSSHLDETFGSYENPLTDANTFLFARLWRSPKGNITLYDVGALKLCENFLPEPVTDKDLVNRLIAQQRRFFVCMRYDAVADRTIPGAVLTDSSEPRELMLPA